MHSELAQTTERQKTIEARLRRLAVERERLLNEENPPPESKGEEHFWERHAPTEPWWLRLLNWLSQI